MSTTKKINYDEQEKMFVYSSQEDNTTTEIHETTFNWSRFVRLLNELKDKALITFDFVYRKKRNNEIKGINVFLDMETVYIWKQSLPKTLSNKYNYILKTIDFSNKDKNRRIYLYNQFEAWKITWEECKIQIEAKKMGFNEEINDYILDY